MRKVNFLFRPDADNVGALVAVGCIVPTWASPSTRLPLVADLITVPCDPNRCTLTLGDRGYMTTTIEHLRSEIAIVIFVDIVGYSLMPQIEQVSVAQELKLIVRIACSHPKGVDTPLTLDTGDGVAIVYFGAPSTAIECAVNLGSRVSGAGIEARIGLHCGPISRVKDVNGRDSVSGPAINLAERVMRCADAGQVLLSSAAAEMAREVGGWGDYLHDLGEHDVKHGLSLRLHNLVTGQCGRSGMPARLAESSRGRASGPNKGNFTVPDRSFVGRRNELEDLIQRIESGTEGFLTITGPGGIGKSRLALEAARAVAPNFADGAWVVACDVLVNREDLISQIAATLGIELRADPLESLAASMSERQILLVIDCFERMTSCGTVLDELMRHCPELQLVVTSRTLVGLPREREIVLGSMSLKPLGGNAADAVTLFVDAAKAALPTFRLNRRSRDYVDRIVHLVEGVPLAIILAAGRLRHLSLPELAEQVEKRPLSVLKRKAVGMDRHADLSRVVEDSFTLLSDGLKSLLVSLSVFRGGFRVSDAEEVLEGTPAVLDGVSELRDNSLLTAQLDGDRMRYRSLDVISEYVEGLVEPDMLHPIRRRHARHFALKANEIRDLYDMGRWREANAGLVWDLGNYRRAVDFATAERDAETVEQLALSLCRLFMEAGYRADFEKLATASQEICASNGNLRLLIETTGLQGGIMRRDRDFAGAERLWLKCTEYCRQAGDAVKEADTWLDLADMALIHGDASKADGYLAEFSLLEGQLPVGPVLASGFAARAKAAVRNGEMNLAKNLASLAHEMAAGLPHRMHTFYVWMSLADVFNSLGEFELSEKLCREGIRETIEGRHYAYTGLLLLKLATALENLGRLSESAHALEIALRVPKSISQTLREQAKAAKEGLQLRKGPCLLRSSEGMTRHTDWIAGARAFGLTHRD